MIIENLEKRAYLSASLGNNGQLLITDTTGNDTIVVKKISTQIQVAINSVITNVVASKIKYIKATSSKGNDSITIDKSISLPATLVGGAGNDSLYGGAGNNNITGGSANNLL